MATHVAKSYLFLKNPTLCDIILISSSNVKLLLRVNPKNVPILKVECYSLVILNKNNKINPALNALGHIISHIIESCNQIKK